MNANMNIYSYLGENIGDFDDMFEDPSLALQEAIVLVSACGDEIDPVQVDLIFSQMKAPVEQKNGMLDWFRGAGILNFVGEVTDQFLEGAKAIGTDVYFFFLRKIEDVKTLLKQNGFL